MFRNTTFLEAILYGNAMQPSATSNVGNIRNDKPSLHTETNYDDECDKQQTSHKQPVNDSCRPKAVCTQIPYEIRKTAHHELVVTHKLRDISKPHNTYNN